MAPEFLVIGCRVPCHWLAWSFCRRFNQHPQPRNHRCLRCRQRRLDSYCSVALKNPTSAGQPTPGTPACPFVSVDNEPHEPYILYYWPEQGKRPCWSCTPVFKLQSHKIKTVGWCENPTTKEPSDHHVWWGRGQWPPRREEEREAQKGAEGKDGPRVLLWQGKSHYDFFDFFFFPKRANQACLS